MKTQSMPARITKNYVPGKGDTGYSEVLRGIKLRKDHPACHIQGKVEEVRHSIELVLSEHKLLQEELTYQLTWLNKNLFCLAAFCYACGNESFIPNQTFPESLLEWMDEQIEKLKQFNGNCKDFLYQSEPVLVKLDGVRIQIRALERYYTAWRFCSEVMQGSIESKEVEHSIAYQAAVLNRISAYLYEATRKESKLIALSLNKQLEESTWVGSIEEFNPPKFI